MKMAKRILLFVATNILIMVTINLVVSVLGLQPYLQANGLNYQSLAVFCLLWGFGGAFISLALSRVMAKWMMGVKLIDEQTSDPQLRSVRDRVYALAQRAGLKVMPEVGYYESPELNAFATGPTENRALVAVSTGLISQMSESAVDGVLAHEIAHVKNGDMVTMTLVQGVVNAFVMFVARIIGWFASQFVNEDNRHMAQFAIVLVAEIILGMLGMMVVAAFSRYREFRADAGGASLAGTPKMIAALQALKLNFRNPEAENEQEEGEPALATLKISGKPNRFARLFSTHPDLDLRIKRLEGALR